VSDFDALWRVFWHVGLPARLVLAAVVLLAVSRLSWLCADWWGWLSARYRLEGASWRLWRARVRHRPFGPGSAVLCLDGAYGIVIGRAGCDRHPDCQPAAVVGFEYPGRLPRIVPLTELVPVPLLDAASAAAARVDARGGVR
jgi:hypothetical protein